MKVVAAVDPALPAALVTAAVTTAAARAGQRSQLAWALQDQPGLLTGAGARAPVPSVLRLTAMQIRWRLRLAAAHREVWTGAQLRRLLAERAGLQLSSASVSALLTRQPAQVKLDTLLALCTALECTPNDLRWTPRRCHPPSGRRAPSQNRRPPGAVPCRRCDRIPDLPRLPGTGQVQ